MSSGKWLSDIRAAGAKHSAVFLDDREYLLYPSEIAKLGLKPETEVSQEVYLRILDVLSARALKYSVYLLKQRDYSIKMLQDRLKNKKYPPESIEYALDCLTEKKYLDDQRYACNYCQTKKEQYGKLRIKNELIARGISSDVIEKALEEGPEKEDALALIERYAHQRGFQKDNCDIKQRDRFYRYLIRKGFEYSDIMDYFEKIEK